MNRARLLAIILSVGAGILFPTWASSQTQSSIGKGCSATVVAMALTTELLRDEAKALAPRANSPIVTRMVKQGVKKLGAEAFYAGVAIGVAAACMGAEIPVPDIPSVSELTSALLGGDGDDPCKGLRDILEEHHKRLADYKNNPSNFDNKGILGHSPERDASIIRGRIANLESQIADFERQLRECEAKNGK